MAETYYHPDPQIDSEVQATVAEGHAFDVAHGLAKEGDCPECGWANNVWVRVRCRNCGAPLPDTKSERSRGGR